MADLQSLKAQLDALRPFPPESLRSLREAMALEWTFNSNAIEGNTLTLKETKVVLEGITVGGRSLREHLEAVNHASAIAFLEEIVSRGEPLTTRLIREIHGLILRGVDDRNAGVWRRENVVISGAIHRPPEFLHVADLMEQLVEEFHRLKDSLGDVELSAWLHSHLARIHPFVDGNGRTARLLMNLFLLQRGWPPVIIRQQDRLRYYEALDRHHTTGQMDDFLDLVEERMEESLLRYLDIMG